MNIVYIGNLDFTRQNACTRRVIGCAKAIVAGGLYKVSIIGYSSGVETLKVDEFNVYSTERGSSKVSKAFNLYTRGSQTVTLLKQIADIHAVVIYGICPSIYMPVYRYCRKNNIKVISDMIEWYDTDNFNCVRRYLVTNFITKTVLKSDGIIAISSYLDNYYKDNGKKTIRVPLLKYGYTQIENSSEVNLEHFGNEYINLIYAGTAGRKDMLSEIIDSLDILNRAGYKMRLHILGENSNIQNKYNNKLPNNVFFYGQVKQENIFTYLSKADFSILVRPNKRYAHAGFPTKFMESLNAGLPAISNITSDIGLYLKDGYNGYIIDGFNVNDIVAKLKDIINRFNRDEMKEMKENAVKSSLELDYKIYVSEINNFLSSI